MSYVRGQVFTERGDLIASFVQEAMLRAFEQDPATHPIPTAARL
jgi:acyl-CoA thioesterase